MPQLFNISLLLQTYKYTHAQTHILDTDWWMVSTYCVLNVPLTSQYPVRVSHREAVNTR